MMTNPSDVRRRRCGLSGIEERRDARFSRRGSIGALDAEIPRPVPVTRYTGHGLGDDVFWISCWIASNLEQHRQAFLSAIDSSGTAGQIVAAGIGRSRRASLFNSRLACKSA